MRITPTDDPAVAAQPARMRTPRRHRSEPAPRHVGLTERVSPQHAIVALTRNPHECSQPEATALNRPDDDEIRSLLRPRSPARHRAIVTQTARMRFTRGHRREPPTRRSRLAGVVVTPTRHRAVGAQPARMPAAHRDRGELPPRRPAWPSRSSPQHSIAPSVRNPHECASPAATAANSPPGASAWPNQLPPQHDTPPSSPSAHECRPPTATAPNEPSGASINSPSNSLGSRSQQAIVPPTRTPQKNTPAENRSGPPHQPC